MTEAQSLRQVIAQTSKAVRTGPIELRRAAEVAASAAMTDNTAPERGDEVVLRLTREEVQVLIGRAELPVGGLATDDNRIRTPLGDKLRAALDQGGSDE